MRLALIGKDISHSKSPELYRKLLGDSVEYELIDVPSEDSLPELSDLSKKFDALNITSPFKKYYYSKVVTIDPMVQELGAINTIKFTNTTFIGTNTDISAVETILTRLLGSHGPFNVIILGSGTMAKLTLMVCRKLGVRTDQKARLLGHNMDKLDLSEKKVDQTVVINCCSRQYVFRGNINNDHIFWDYNYNFAPHEQELQLKVKLYLDGQELLTLQAIHAIQFWSGN